LDREENEKNKIRERERSNKEPKREILISQERKIPPKKERQE